MSRLPRLSSRAGRGVRRLLTVSLFAQLALVTAAEAAGVDPFYRSLLRDGRLAWERGDYLTAAKRFRLACFGFLDEPPLLVEGLTRLAMSQVELNDEVAFRESFDRILEIQDQFDDAYPKSLLSAAFRQRFEEEVSRLVPSHYLETSAAFTHLARNRGAEAPNDAQEQLSGLPPKRRRRELEARIAQDPDNTRWHVVLAETDLELRRYRAALEVSLRTLELDPGNQDAICVRGRAHAALEHCPAAVPDLESCRRSFTEAEAATDLLGCYLDLGQEDRARRLVESLPDSVRGDRAFSKLQRRIPPPEPGAPTSTSETPLPAGVATDDTEPSSVEPISSEQRQQRLNAARDLLAQARSIETLDQALLQARPVADLEPPDSEAQYLVAEIAYRASRWQEAAYYFQRAGDPGDDRPRLLFYMAVTYYETGQTAAAAAILRRCVSRLQRSSYVESYIDKILGPAG